MKLYTSPASGNAYKCDLLLALLGVKYESIAVNLAANESRTASFLAINPRGQIPVLVEGDLVIWDSQAILAWIARQFGEDWFPQEPAALSEVMAWLAFAQNECLFGLARARAVKVFGRPWDLQQCQEFGRAGLSVLDSHLAKHDWLAAGRVTIADVACYPYVGLAPAGGIEIDSYTNILAWMRRIQALNGYVHMDGIARV
jgi:glutathione S-transferase